MLLWLCCRRCLTRSFFCSLSFSLSFWPHYLVHSLTRQHIALSCASVSCLYEYECVSFLFSNSHLSEIYTWLWTLPLVFQCNGVHCRLPHCCRWPINTFVDFLHCSFPILPSDAIDSVNKKGITLIHVLWPLSVFNLYHFFLSTFAQFNLVPQQRYAEWWRFQYGYPSEKIA